MSQNKLPVGWISTTLGDISNITYGKGLSIKKLLSTGYPVFGANSVIGYYDEYLYEDPQLLISCRGAGSGRINFSPKKSFVTNNSLVIGFPVDADILRKIYYYFLQSANKDGLVTGSAQPQVTINNAVDLKLNLPPLNEQHRIIAKIEALFSELDNGIAALKTAREQLKVYRKAVLKHAFEGKLTTQWREENKDKLESPEQLLARIQQERKARYQQQLADWQQASKDWEANGKEGKRPTKPQALKNTAKPNDEELANFPDLPENWIWVKLGELTWSVKDGPHYSPKYTESGIPFISGGNVRPSGIDFDSTKFIAEELHQELSVRCRPDLGDVLYTKGGTTGIARVNTYNFEFNVWVHIAVLKITDSLNSFYLQHVLNSPSCYSQSQKYTHGVGNQDLGLTRMVKIILPLCSMHEQRKIVDQVDMITSSLDKIEDSIESELAKAQVLRQSILKKAFSGQLVPQDPNDEPASELLARIQTQKAAQAIKSKKTAQSSRKLAFKQTV